MTDPGDENLTAALAELDAAVQRLCGIRSTDAGIAPPLLTEIDQRRHERAQPTGRRGVRTSGSPMCIESLDLWTEIERVTAPARNHPDESPAAILDRLTGTGEWRPQDADTVQDWAETVADWARQARHICEPEARLEVRAACPACGTRTVYRHSEGEDVRKPALTVTATDGARCLACAAHWPPSQLGVLIAVLEAS